MTERQLISEPERIRALAHPLRLELIDHLNDVGEATATQCAEHTGESVASCSFHLRMLAKYGYIEPAEQRGREKPWKLIHATRDMRPSPDVPGSLAAVVELGVIGVLRESERIREYLAFAQQEDQEWIEASTLCMSDFWVTREEMAEISATLAELAQRYLHRNSDPELRPEGARKSRLFGVVNPDPRKRKESDGD
jgi:DNA-binding transcriptional ArsR family regulator